jgi:hypothetical protein
MASGIRVLDEPGWRPLPETYKLLLTRAGPSTALELMAKLKSDKLPCRRWPAGSSQCELVSASFWESRQFDATWIGSDELDICGLDAVPGPGRRYNPQTDFDGREFYVLRPETVWPVLALQAADASETEEPLRRKTGPSTADEWQWCVAFKYCEARHKGKPLPSTSDLMQACVHELGMDKPPDRSGVNKLVNRLIQLLG